MSPRATDPRTRFAALTGFAAAVTALAWSSSFDLDPFDSSELALVAVTRGLAHPPGQPFHTLLGWLLTRLPLDPLVLLPFLSIIPAAIMLSVGIVYSFDSIDETATPRFAWLAASVTALLACALPMVREVCARVEVYGLAASLTVCAIFTSERKSRGMEALAGLLVGLAGATNPVIAAQSVGIIVAVVMSRRWRSLLPLAVGTSFGLLSYLYAFLARSRETVTLVWGAPHDLHSLVRLLTARDFQRNVSPSISVLAQNLGHLLLDLIRNGTIPFIAMGLYGLARCTPAQTRTSRMVSIALSLAIGMLMIAANVPYLSKNPDYGGYLLVPIGLASVGVFQICSNARPWITGVALFATVLANIAGIAQNKSTHVTRALALHAVADLPPGSILVLSSDHLLFPILYLQFVEHVRPDVTVINTGWASSGWAWHLVHARDPSLRLDLTPGMGPRARLALALQSRMTPRTINSESLDVLRSATHGGICPRGMGWSSADGCTLTRSDLDATLSLLAHQAVAAHVHSWDRTLVMYSGQSMGNDALALGCPGLAVRFYRAALGDLSPTNRLPRPCDGRQIRPILPRGLLEIESDDLTREVAHVLEAPVP